ncbi:MAG: futalosine hydrolase [Phycisphaerales bacterium]
MPSAPANSTLFVVASPLEARAVISGLHADTSLSDAAPWLPHLLTPSMDFVISGVGKSNAAAATSLAIQRRPYRNVICVGIAGALPGADLALADVVLGSASAYADEGIITPTGFQTCQQMGFPLGPFEHNAVPADPELLHHLRPLARQIGVIATVSTCSGTDAAATAVRARTGAIAETMEGAAVGHACLLTPPLGHHTPSPPRFIEVRVISNTTGDRHRQQWHMSRALAALAELGRSLVGTLSQPS